MSEDVDGARPCEAWLREAGRVLSEETRREGAQDAVRLGFSIVQGSEGLLGRVGGNGMFYDDFLNHVIDDGMEAAKADYTAPEQKDKLDGSLKGFEECRGRDPQGLNVLLQRAQTTTVEKFREQAADFRYWRCREAEIEWVCNVVAAAGFPTMVASTARGYFKVAEIVRKAEGYLVVEEGA